MEEVARVVPSVPTIDLPTEVRSYLKDIGLEPEEVERRLWEATSGCTQGQDVLDSVYDLSRRMHDATVAQRTGLDDKAWKLVQLSGMALPFIGAVTAFLKLPNDAGLFSTVPCATGALVLALLSSVSVLGLAFRAFRTHDFGDMNPQAVFNAEAMNGGIGMYRCTIILNVFRAYAINHVTNDRKARWLQRAQWAVYVNAAALAAFAGFWIFKW